MKIYPDFSEITQIKMYFMKMKKYPCYILIQQKNVHMPYQCPMIIEVARN
jgi:hypothetical protein